MITRDHKPGERPIPSQSSSARNSDFGGSLRRHPHLDDSPLDQGRGAESVLSIVERTLWRGPLSRMPEPQCDDAMNVETKNHDSAMTQVDNGRQHFDGFPVTIPHYPQNYKTKDHSMRRVLFACLKIVALLTTRPGIVEADDADGSLNSTVVFQHDAERHFDYRIPALTVAKDGALLAFCERRVGLHDHGQNDIVLRRSSDGGESWDKLQVIADEGGDSLNDPCVVVLDTGRILLRYTRFPKGVHARKSRITEIAEPGYGGPKNVRIYLTHSDDHGVTWATPRDVTRQMRRPDAIAVGSPGVGLQLSRGPHEGRVLLPTYQVYRVGDEDRYKHNSVAISDDGGETWQHSEEIAEPKEGHSGDEAQMVELADGSILLTARDEPEGQYRMLSVSKDAGETWSEHRFAKDLKTPRCMSSILRISMPSDEKPGLLWHTLPHTADSRSNGTIMVSLNEGQTWEVDRVIEPNGFAYSCLTMLPNGDVGCLYETDEYSKIVFVRLASPRSRGDAETRGSMFRRSNLGGRSSR